MTKARFVQARQGIFYGKYIYDSVPAMAVLNEDDIRIPLMRAHLLNK